MEPRRGQENRQRTSWQQNALLADWLVVFWVGNGKWAFMILAQRSWATQVHFSGTGRFRLSWIPLLYAFHFSNADPQRVHDHRPAFVGTLWEYIFFGQIAFN